MRRYFLLACVFLFAFVLVGCKASSKTFTGSGVTITLDSTFIEKEVMQAPLYLESKNYFFMAAREGKNQLDDYNILTSDQYIRAEKSFLCDEFRKLRK